MFADVVRLQHSDVRSSSVYHHAAGHLKKDTHRLGGAVKDCLLLDSIVVNSDCFRCLVVSFVHSRLDYGNFMFVGLPAYLDRRLHAVLNAARRSSFGISTSSLYDHVSDALAILHWLCMPGIASF